MNKAELIDALATRLGDKKQAVAALDAVLTEIQTTVTRGDKVAITGFGVFEKRVRAARVARNPRTGEAVKVKKTSIPAFRPGTGFRELVASGKVPKVAGARRPAVQRVTSAAVPAKATRAAAASSTKAAVTKAAARKPTTKAAATSTRKAAASKPVARTTRAAGKR